MICLRCDHQGFIPKDIEIEQEFKQEILKVQTPGLECEMCGWQTVPLDQLDQLRRNTADEYRRKHGLLTSTAIKAMRIALEMNRQDFARYVGVGEASVQRWETWLVQEKSSDELLRLKFKEASRVWPAP